MSETVPEFSESYAKAHKAYGLASALLLAWELVGVDFGPSPFESLRITLKSPEAVPYVIVALVVYFGFRITVEWFQSDSRRRAAPASKIDFAVAHLIGICSLTLFAIQTALRFQLANTGWIAPISVILIGTELGAALRRAYAYRRHLFALDGASVGGAILLVVMALGLGAWAAAASVGVFVAYLLALLAGMRRLTFVGLMVSAVETVEKYRSKDQFVRGK